VTETVARLIGTRVARRLFLLFVLAAFVPLAAIAFVSLTQVHAILLKQGEQRLTASAKSYGMEIFERLLLAAEVAISTASAPKGTLPGDSLGPRTFESLGILDEDGAVRPVIGRPDDLFLSTESRSRLVRGKAVVIVTDATASPRIHIATPLPPPSKEIAFGEVRPEHLWGTADELPARHHPGPIHRPRERER